VSLPGLRTQTLPGQREASKAPLIGTQLQQLTRLLAPNFLPASMSQPPTADSTNTGNRVIAVTTNTQSVPKPEDSAILQLTVAGGISTLTWSFKTKFTVPPSVTAIPQGAGTGTLFVKGASATNEVIIQSTDNADTRTVHLHASQPSQGD